MYNGDLSMNTWTVPQFALFNLEEDIEEATDVSDQNQEVFDRLEKPVTIYYRPGPHPALNPIPNRNL